MIPNRVKNIVTTVCEWLLLKILPFTRADHKQSVIHALCAQRWSFLEALLRNVCSETQLQEIALSYSTSFALCTRDLVPKSTVDAIVDVVCKHIHAMNDRAITVLFMAIHEGNRMFATGLLKKADFSHLSADKANNGCFVCMGLFANTDDAELLSALLKNTSLRKNAFANSITNAHLMAKLAVRSPRIQDALLKCNIDLDDMMLVYHIKNITEPETLTTLIANMVLNGYNVSQHVRASIPNDVTPEIQKRVQSALDGMPEVALYPKCIALLSRCEYFEKNNSNEMRDVVIPKICDVMFETSSPVIKRHALRMTNAYLQF